MSIWTRTRFVSVSVTDVDIATVLWGPRRLCRIRYSPHPDRPNGAHAKRYARVTHLEPPTAGLPIRVNFGESHLQVSVW
ncbi:hypothetical protein MSIMFB_02957 [Mycobacterium simulans]|uniref:Uncharacterized protein n=1 Tax=Mycobacterium simulans TaxID=627089 RepID=A0A7Z7IKX8_9MYCO|nr:hypothetical protein MSIMFB_02957 [Mycobacterium simulans]